MDYHLLFYRSRFGEKDILTSSETYIGRTVLNASRAYRDFYSRLYSLYFASVKTRALSHTLWRGKPSPRSQVLAAILATRRCGLVRSPLRYLMLC